MFLEKNCGRPASQGVPTSGPGKRGRDTLPRPLALSVEVTLPGGRSGQA